MTAVTQPSGEVTLVFSDIEGSTRLLEELGTDAYREALAEHRRIVREACARHQGYEVDYEGDAFFYAFTSAPHAVSAVSEAMAGLEQGPIRIRVGMHTGEPGLDPPKYVGMDVHFAARVMSSAHGGQVVLSKATADLVEAPLVSLGAHRLKDIAEPVSLFQLGEGAHPVLKTIANTNLPTPASRFVGRDEELRAADHLLQDTRLLTIHGPGGQGKTRFALELATRAREERFADYADGVFSCFLASLRDPALVLPTIAQTLAVREEQGASALEALTVHVQARKLLLLLDNLEHLLDAASGLSRLLESCPNLTLLITSRELLRISGEEPFALPPLPQNDGVALFCERSGLAPSETIAAIADRLEGLPLAIELAAARTRILSPEQLLERLSSRLDLLKGGRDADPRQQTLRATIEWSYDLLSPEEQQTFARLSVFAGGCTLEAAEEVCDADVDALQLLVDKSLLRFTEERFWMLETIREYAGEKLEESREADAISRRYVAAIAELVDEANELIRGAGIQEGSARIDRELGNVRAALTWAGEHERAGFYRLAAAMWMFWLGFGSTSEGVKWLSRALEFDGDAAVRCQLLGGLSWLYQGLGENDAAERVARERLELAAELGDARSQAGAYGLLALVAEDRGHMNEAEALLEASSSLEDDYKMRFNQAIFAVRHRRYASAHALLDEVAAAARSAGDEHMVTLCSVQRAALAIDSGHPRDALPTLATAIRFFEGEALNVETCLSELGRALVALGRGEVGVRLLGAAEAIRVEAEWKPLEASKAILDASRHAARANFGETAVDNWYADGLMLSLAEAVELALASADDVADGWSRHAAP